MQNVNEHTLIEKEAIPELKFKNEVSVEQAPNLRNQLIHAARLGNTYHGKIRIEFIDDSGPKVVETTVWAVGAQFICLKGGVWLPISRIKNISGV